MKVAILWKAIYRCNAIPRNEKCNPKCIWKIKRSWIPKAAKRTILKVSQSELQILRRATVNSINGTKA
jgi:hypothetical protein